MSGNEENGRVASDELKLSAADQVGFGEKVRTKGWESATTKEIGLMVREMIRRGEMEVAKEYGEPNAPAQMFPEWEVCSGASENSTRIWDDFTPKEMFRISEAMLLQRQNQQGNDGR